MDPEGTAEVTGAGDLDDIDLDVAAEVLGDEGQESAETGTPATQEPVDPFADFGGRDAIEKAHRMYQDAQTEDGVIRLWLEAGRSMGLGLREMEAFVQGNMAAAQAQEEPAEEDLDRVMTFRDWQEQQAQMLQAQQAVQQQQAQAVAKATLAETFQTLGVNAADPSANLILQLADRYLKGPNDLSPESVRNAVTRGHADYQALVAAEAKNYLKQKVETRQSLPKSPSGSAAPSAPPTEEPKSIEEAFARVRKQLGRG